MQKLYAVATGLLLLLAGINSHSQSTNICQADFERIAISTTANPLHASFRALPSHVMNKRPVRICWEFGDGRDTCIIYSNTYQGPYVVHHNYANPGNYEVCVKIRYEDNCEARRCRLVVISRPDSCRADFEKLPSPSLVSNQVVLKALPTHNNNKKPREICWRFGDGRDTCITYPENYTGNYTVTHRYAQPGTYNVCVLIRYYGGCVADKCKPIQVPPAICAVNLHELSPSVNSLLRAFIATPYSLPPRVPVRVCWYFGDGEDTCIMLTNTTATQNLTIAHTYPGPGVYRACVKVFFDGGCIAQKCVEVVIRSNTNVCGGFMVDSQIGPRIFKFRAQAIHRPNDEPVSYLWHFGDGTSASGREVTHAYNVAGVYNVCVRIRTRLGCETHICKPLVVGGQNQTVLHLSPNPVINVLHASFFSSHTETVLIRILNSSGGAVRTYTRNAIQGVNTWNFDLSTLMPGQYMFVVQSPNQIASAIFLKQ